MALTNEDLAAIKELVNSSVDGLRVEFKAEMGEMRTEMGEMRTEMGEMRTEMREFRRELSEVREIAETTLGKVEAIENDIGELYTADEQHDKRITRLEKLTTT